LDPRRKLFTTLNNRGGKLKVKKKLLSVLLSTAMVAALLAGCNKTTPTSETTPAGSEVVTSQVPGGAGDVVDVETLEDTGDTLTIYVWNEEWLGFFEKYMPNYTRDNDADPLAGHLGDLPVVWVENASTDNVYQTKLDEALKDPNADVDIFLVEADYAGKYTVPGVAKPLGELGITDADLADQFAYTQQVVTTDGVLYGSSWQTCGAGMIYNREIAKEVLGTDDPDEVQAKVSTWEDYQKVAADMKAKGYLMTPRASSTYRVFSNNVSSPWIKDGEINLDPSIKKWVDMSKEMVEAGETKTGDLWDAGDTYTKNTTFCVFGPAWFFNFCMGVDDPASIAAKGGWGLCAGPQAHYWGGTWVCVADKSDNLATAADIVKTMTLDKDVLTKLVENENQDCNSKELADKYANDATFGNDILGGQNPYTIFSKAIGGIDVSNMSQYDQQFNETFQTYMDDYFDGKLTYDEAYEKFETAVKEKVPVLNN
jgi:ABC-type glycerol-3-phosphate transport system substrate-binding protein